MSEIIGLDGKPLRRQDKQKLTEEIADARLTGVRNVWHGTSIASGLTPVALADVLHRAANGDAYDFLTLAEEIEERDLHYGSVLGTRKRAVSGLDTNVEPGGDEQRDNDIAEAVRAIIEEPEFCFILEDMLDGLGKGYSAIELIWDTSEGQWLPDRLEWRDPRFFEISQKNGWDLLLKTDENPMGEALSPFKFMVHRPRIKSGLPIRGALGRMVSVAYMCKSFALGDWMTFAEVFGMPIRVGKYHSGATQAEIDTLRSAVASIGTDAAAVMPEKMMLEFIESKGGAGGEELYERLCDWLDRQVSKGVLGQTMTADDGSSRSQAQVHNEVRQDIMLADAKQLAITINRDLIRPFVDFNYGPQKRYPRVTFNLAEAEDVVATTSALKELVPLGLRVSATGIAERFGLPAPESDDDVLRPAGQTSPPNDPGKESPPAALNAQVALNQQAAAASDVIDELTELMSDGWEEQLEPIINPVLQLAERSTSAEEFRAGLLDLVAQMDERELVMQLADGLFRARGLGESAS